MSRSMALVSTLVGWWAVSPAGAAALDDQNPPNTQQTPAAGAQQAPVAAAKEAPKKQDLGAWWDKSSMEYHPVPERWLFHATGTFSYMNASGNTSGNTEDFTGSGVLRKSRFTSRSFASVSRKNMIYGFTRSSVNYVERTLREQVDYDLAWCLKLVGGIEHYRNTLMFMDKRLNVYGGLGGTLFKNQNQALTLTAGLGHADFTFDRAQLLLVNPHQIGVMNTSPSSGGALAMQAWRWRVSPRFNFSEDASYMKYFDDYLGHLWTINLNGNFPIDKRFSFNSTYRVKEETNSIIKALRVLPQDRTFLLGFRVTI